MNNKTILKSVAAIALAFSASSIFAEEAAAPSCHSEAKPAEEISENAKDVYTCPMHPEVVSDKPGKCPICGMFLEKKQTPNDKKIDANDTPNAEHCKHDSGTETHAHAKSETTTLTHGHEETKSGHSEHAKHAHSQEHGEHAETTTASVDKDVSASEQSPSDAKTLYTCGMHPQIIRDKPGDCPICGMKLVPMRKNKSSSGGSAAGNEIFVEPSTLQKLNVLTAKAERKTAARTISAFSKADFAEENYFDIALKYDAWLEKIFVNSKWETVKKGQPLFEIYSPELFNAAQNYVVALKTKPANESLKRAAEARLKLLDAPQEYIADLQNTLEAKRTYVYKAPRDGVVVEKFATQGSPVSSGSRIYSMADLGKVWILAELFDKDLPFVKVGSPAKINIENGDENIEIDSEVVLIEPRIDGASRTATARIVVENPDLKIRPGALAKTSFKAEESPDAVLVPDTAVLRSGNSDTVFIALGNGTFRPQKVKLGIRTNEGKYEILEGLNGEESVVVSGQFLLDSESRLREALMKIDSDSSSNAVSAAPAHKH